MQSIGFVLKTIAVAAVTILDTIRAAAALTISKNDKVYHRYARNWSRKLLKICGVEVEICGSEKLSQDENYVYVTNHSSLFDIPIMLGTINDDIRIIYKRELEKVPIFGWGLKRSPFIAVSRNQARDAMKSINEAVSQIRSGASVLVFPEGTRSPDGKVGQFKRGAFLLAARAQKPIVPISILNSSKILPSGSYRFNSGKVKLIIHSPIDSKMIVSGADEKKILEQVRETIISGIEK